MATRRLRSAAAIDAQYLSTQLRHWLRDQSGAAADVEHADAGEGPWPDGAVPEQDRQALREMRHAYAIEGVHDLEGAVGLPPLVGKRREAGDLLGTAVEVVTAFKVSLRSIGFPSTSKRSRRPLHGHVHEVGEGATNFPIAEDIARL